MSEPNVEVNVEIPPEEPEPESSPEVVVVEAADNASDAVEAEVVSAAVDNAADVARLEVIVAQQAEEIANLQMQLANTQAGTIAAIEAADQAAAMANEAMEPDNPPASEDTEPEREHWWFRSRK